MSLNIIMLRHRCTSLNINDSVLAKPLRPYLSTIVVQLICFFSTVINSIKATNTMIVLFTFLPFILLSEVSTQSLRNPKLEINCL
jgi:hypothetical protein